MRVIPYKLHKASCPAKTIKTTNPASQLSTIQVKADEANSMRAF